MRFRRGASGLAARSPGRPHEPPAGGAPHPARGDGDCERMGAHSRTGGGRGHGYLALHRAPGNRAGPAAGYGSAPRGTRASAARQDRGTADGRYGAGGPLEGARRCRRCVARPGGGARPADRSRRRRTLAGGLRQANTMRQVHRARRGEQRQEVRPTEERAVPPVDVRAVDLSSLAPGMRQGELVLEGGRGEVRRRRRPERRRKTLPQRRLSLVRKPRNRTGGRSTTPCRRTGTLSSRAPTSLTCR